MMNKSLFLLGGTAWINLVNTTYISQKEIVDILIEPTSTIQWLEENNLLRESDYLALENEEWLKSLIIELRLLRDLSKTILSELENQENLSLHVTEQLKSLTKQVKVSLIIDSDSDKLKLVAEGRTPKDHVLYMIIHSIIQTLDTVPIQRIRNCEHAECRLYFVDTSKSGKRRWCSMELCGNRQKAAEFYARKKKK